MKNGDYIMVIASEDYPGKKYRDRYCYEHHFIYWKHTGVIPNENELIHHKDENKHNNNFSNLELKTRANHSSQHTSARGKQYVIVECPVCKKVFERERRNTHLVKKAKWTCCSRQCSGVLSNDKEERFSLDNNIIEVFRKFS